MVLAQHLGNSGHRRKASIPMCAATCGYSIQPCHTASEKYILFVSGMAAAVMVRVAPRICIRKSKKEQEMLLGLIPENFSNSLMFRGDFKAEFTYKRIL